MGQCRGVSKVVLAFAFKRSARSSRAFPTQAGTSIKATTFLFSRSSKRKRFMASIKTSMPLFLNSYRPLVETMSVSSPKVSPVRQLATCNNSARARFRLVVKALDFGTKSSSNPFGSTTSTSLSSSSRHSLAVMSLTVVKQSTFHAVCFSIECLLCMFNSSAIWSPL